VVEHIAVHNTVNIYFIKYIENRRESADGGETVSLYRPGPPFYFFKYCLPEVYTRDEYGRVAAVSIRVRAVFTSKVLIFNVLHITANEIVIILSRFCNLN